MDSTPITTDDIDRQLEHFRNLFAQHNQAHVFNHTHTLTPAQKQHLLHDVQQIDIQHLNSEYQRAIYENEQQTILLANPTANILTPHTDTTHTQHATPQQRQQWYDDGMQLLANNRVGLVLMSGGSGTRLKSAQPKGMYDIGLPSHKSLFQIHAERILRLQVLAEQWHAQQNKQSDGQTKPVMINWYIMTSVSTHTAIQAYFAQHQYFGLQQQQCMFFTQAELPAFDINTGAIIMQDKHSIALSPNGNGGIYSAMHRNGVLSHMQQSGVQYVHVYGIDNVLVKAGDPWFVGWFAQSRAPVGNKVVLKSQPSEKVGVMCVRNGKTCVVEYSEMPEELTKQRDSATGQLLYGAANIVQHLFTIQTMQQLAVQPLPYHIARKAIPCIDVQTSDAVQPTEPNGIKLEMFIFDVFAMVNRVVAFAVGRQDEFSPVKNASGDGVVDSPATAVRDVTAYHTRLIEAAGGKVVTTDASNTPRAVEVDGRVTYAGEDLEQVVRGKTYTAPVYIQ